jgi:hypothetical protein
MLGISRFRWITTLTKHRARRLAIAPRVARRSLDLHVRTIDAEACDVKIAILAILVLTGALHFVAVGKHYPAAPLWAMAGTALLISAAMFATSSAGWWVVAAVAVLVSQLLLATAWSDARAGTA